jgi:hypothetical protein
VSKGDPLDADLSFPLRLGVPLLSAGLFVGIRGANRQAVDSLCREFSSTGHAPTEPSNRLRFGGVGLQPDLDQAADGFGAGCLARSGPMFDLINECLGQSRADERVLTRCGATPPFFWVHLN